MEENIETMVEKRVYDYLGVAQVLLEKQFEIPKRDLHEKKGKGIYKRKIFTVPAAGEGSANQHVMQGKKGGITGSQKCRQFTSVGTPMSIRMRLRSCHDCPSCMNLDPENKAQLECGSCKQTGLCGPVGGEIIQLHAESGTSGRIGIARSIPAARGAALAANAKEGEVVCMIVADEPQPFCIGVVSKAQFKVQHNTACSSGGVKQGDLLVTMRKLEPASAGSSTFVVTDRLLNVHSHCMRLCGIQTENEKRSKLGGVLVQGNDKSTGTYTEGQKKK